jgi:predicted peptidase
LKRGFVHRVYEDPQKSKYQYTVFVPADYSGERPYPLIVFLHGFGKRGTEGRDYLIDGLAPALRMRLDTFGFLAVFPQGHSGSWPVGGDDERAVLGIISEVETTYNVDPKRISLTGISSGGQAVWDMAAAHPDRWAAIVPVSTSGCDPSQAPRFAKLPCWCFHNAYDVHSPPTIPRGMIAALRNAGGAPRYTEFYEMISDAMIVGPGPRHFDHDAWDKAYDLPDLYEWLIVQRRP